MEALYILLLRKGSNTKQEAHISGDYLGFPIHVENCHEMSKSTYIQFGFIIIHIDLPI